MRTITTYLLILTCAFAYGQDPANDASPKFIYNLTFGNHSAKKKKDMDLERVTVKWITDSGKADSTVVIGSEYNLILELNREYVIYLTKEGYQGYRQRVNTTLSSEYLNEDGNTGSHLHANFIKLDETTDGKPIKDIGIIDCREYSKWKDSQKEK